MLWSVLLCIEYIEILLQGDPDFCFKDNCAGETGERAEISHLLQLQQAVFALIARLIEHIGESMFTIIASLAYAPYSLT